ncbi:hypothetical protein L226DRAFT_573441 [Lentinus tigrinus ALCF2SS1-7]|uniref:Uncharacterized protein n=1 Tax=Lentinus tigrinus ALCF2SS1-6 TaxID=1328759 RepID=A0A5C2S1L5_9APHY|nr:hypothetical protein L227DRAFT_613719 [Lentinus tigrinus ALCF2SS1-6]RPD72076.1 hypothetical protein L226DRAFT_573441 [Lentinus tigrinus ALCF2SS1-7]
MDSMVYLAIFGLSFTGGFLTPLGSWLAGVASRTSPIPVSPVLHTISGLVAILACLFILTHILLSNIQLAVDVRHACQRILQAVWLERAGYVLRQAVEGSRTPGEDLLRIPARMEVFNFWVSCAVYYVLLSVVQAACHLGRNIGARKGWGSDKASQLTSGKQEPQACTARRVEPLSEYASPPPERYRLTVFQYFRDDTLSMPGFRNAITSEHGILKALFTGLVTVDELRAVDLTVSIPGVQYAIPSLDLHEGGQASRDPLGRLPVQYQMPLDLPAGRVVLDVLLSPADGGEEDGDEDSNADGNGEVDHTLQGSSTGDGETSVLP